MSFSKTILPALATLALVSTLPGTAQAQQHGSQKQRAQNAEATANMRMRIAAAIDRVSVTEQKGKLSAARSATIRQQLAQSQREMATLSRRQGFVSAAQLASYDRLIVGVDKELGDAAVALRPYGNDGLPSAEVTAFQRTHARLRYRDARIEFDRRECAVYQGTAGDGKVRREPLRDSRGRQICPKR